MKCNEKTITMAKKLTQIFHLDLYGKREDKYDFLDENSINSIEWTELKPEEPNFFFTNKNFDGQEEYEKGFKVDELFIQYNNGIETGKDAFFYSLTKNEIEKKVENAFIEKEKAIKEFEITDTTSFRFKEKFLLSKYDKSKIRKINYRPFDIVFSYYDETLQRRPAFSTMKNMFQENIGLLVPRQVSDDFRHVFISNFPTDCNLTSTAKRFGSAPLFPLYLYSDDNENHTISLKLQERVPNLNEEIISEIEDKLSLQFVAEKDTSTTLSVHVETERSRNFAPIDLLDYIYAVLHSPTYREKYKEFLKIDFPRVPYPKDAETFWKLVELGKQIREIHLLESPIVEKYITQYPMDGDNVVDKIKYEDDKVFINDNQYFNNVPETAWNFYIGGYQPAQKWLKDRRNRTLTFEDILHYQKIVVALTETDRLMAEVDLINLS